MTRWKRYPFALAAAMRAALRGKEAEQMDQSIDEEVGFLALADAVQSLWHLRAAWSKE